MDSHPPGQLYIRYVELSQVKLWEKNSKKHDPKLSESIERYGFRDAPIWDDHLNKGKGGIIGGNGRIEALCQMRSAGKDTPKFIGTDNDGNWYVPIQFGGTSDSLATAEAFAIDHNNLTLAGFSATEKQRLWEADKYLAMVKDLSAKEELPTSVPPEELALLIKLAADAPPENEGEGGGGGGGDGEKPRGTLIKFYVQDPGLIDQAIAATGIEDKGVALETICSQYLG